METNKYSPVAKYRFQSLQSIKKLFYFTEEECNIIQDFLSGLYLDGDTITIEASPSFEQIDPNATENKIYSEAEIVELIQNYMNAIEDNIAGMKLFLTDLIPPLDKQAEA